MTFGGVAHGVRRSGGDPRRSADDGASRRVGAAIGTPEKSNAKARVAFGASTSGKENAAPPDVLVIDHDVKPVDAEADKPPALVV